MHNWMEETEKAQQAFSDERQKFNSRMTKDANLDRIDKMAIKLHEDSLKRHAKVDAETKFQAAQADEALIDKMIVKQTAQAAEIRSVFLGKNGEAANAMMRTAFDDNDVEVIAALVG
jgi:hypothetical protein